MKPPTHASFLQRQLHSARLESLGRAASDRITTLESSVEFWRSQHEALGVRLVWVRRSTALELFTWKVLSVGLGLVVVAELALLFYLTRR